MEETTAFLAEEKQEDESEEYDENEAYEEEEEEEEPEKERERILKRLLFVFYMPETDNITTAVQTGTEGNQKTFVSSMIETLNRTNASYSGRSLLISCPKTSLLEAVASFRNTSPSVEYSVKEEISVSKLKKELRNDRFSPCCEAKRGENAGNDRTVWQGKYYAKWDEVLCGKKKPSSVGLPKDSGNVFVKRFLSENSRTATWTRLPCKFSLYTVMGGQEVVKRMNPSAGDTSFDKKYKFWMSTEAPTEGWRFNVLSSRVGYPHFRVKKEAMALLETMMGLKSFFDREEEKTEQPTVVTTITTTMSENKLKTTQSTSLKTRRGRDDGKNKRKGATKTKPVAKRGGNQNKGQEQQQQRSKKEEEEKEKESWDRIMWIPQYPHVELKLDNESWFLRWGESVSKRNGKKYIFNNTHGAFYVTKQVSKQIHESGTVSKTDRDEEEEQEEEEGEGDDRWTRGARLIKKYLNACEAKNVPFGKSKFWFHHFYDGVWNYSNYAKHPISMEDVIYLREAETGRRVSPPNPFSILGCLGVLCSAEGDPGSLSELTATEEQKPKRRTERSEYETHLKDHLERSIEEGMVCSELVANAMLAVGLVRHVFDYDPSLYLWASSTETSAGIDYGNIKKHLERKTMKRGIEKKETMINGVCDFWLVLGCCNLMDGFYGDGGSLRVDEWLNVYLDPKKCSPNDVWLALELCGFFQRCPHCITWVRDLPEVISGSTFLTHPTGKNYNLNEKRNEWLNKSNHLWGYDVCDGILKQ